MADEASPVEVIETSKSDEMPATDRAASRKRRQSSRDDEDTPKRQRIDDDQASTSQLHQWAGLLLTPHVASHLQSTTITTAITIALQNQKSPPLLLTLFLPRLTSRIVWFLQP